MLAVIQLSHRCLFIFNLLELLTMPCAPYKAFKCLASVMQQLLFPVSTVSTGNVFDHDPHLYTKYEEKQWLADYESRCYASKTNK